MLLLFARLHRTEVNTDHRKNRQDGMFLVSSGGFMKIMCVGVSHGMLTQIFVAVQAQRLLTAETNQ